jgi:hypothetical protein
MLDALIILAVGWLLLVPPIKKVDSLFYETDEKQPYSEWEQRGAYDTAKDCEIERDDLIAGVWRRALEEKQKEAATNGTKGNTVPEDQIDEIKNPSKVLLKLKADMEASLRAVQTTACGASNVLGSSKACELRRNDLQVKAEAYITRVESERQKQESKEDTEKRWRTFDKALEDLTRTSKMGALDSAHLKARCLPPEALFSSQPKK